MKIEITQKGVYDAKGQEIEVGTEMDIKGDTVPAWLVNKGRVLAEAKGKAAVTNTSGAERQARLKEIAMGLADGDFIASGAPDVAKVNELLNEDETAFTAAERDQVWPGIAADVIAARKAA
ncbi:hypothetical protein IP68_12400 [Blastomonas sp. AAP25]|uniref:hypothetical protein n=1 Tax=Blastomonas sp. AAP25 TaxID=1523416 RepID=UPI0006B897B9|nr:hypothetical protein [Blastomonas sp. AAP25]KPF74559.1 hypothetical protein IP68_12400 [Blastomonas sp. AAP25]